MAALGTTSYIENITHQTQHRPFSIHHTIVQPNVPCALYLHCHSEMEFFYLEKGKVTLQVEDKDYFLQEGDAARQMCFTAPGAPVVCWMSVPSMPLFSPGK